MVASSQRLASHIGARVLADGGTAADACVAMDAALHVTEPTSTGLGGDLFALHHDGATGAVTALNASGRAPAALALDALLAHGPAGPPASHGLWITAPGCCAGWHDLAARHGTMPMARLLAPAIALAEDGFAVGAITAAAWARALPQLRSRALTLDGRAPAAGETFRNPGLARVLRAIAEGGRDAFYRGAVADAVADAAQRAGGVLTRDDLALHASIWDAPIATDYRGVRVWECPPNGQGLAALLALNVLDGLDLAATAPDEPARWHLLVEALRLAFADARWWVGDPGAARAPLDPLLSSAYAAERRALVDPARAMVTVARGTPRPLGGTVYHCAVDARGNACSVVSSHFIGFGTGLVPDGCGFVLHNRALGFALEAAHPNVAAPGKRPYHTITPGLLTRADGTLWGPFGVMGGFMQPQGHVQLVTALVDDGAAPQDALDRPRFCIDVEGGGRRVQLEAGVPDAVADGLRARGHDVIAGIPSFGRALFGRGQAILRDGDGALAGGSDRRADGGAVGIP